MTRRRVQPSPRCDLRAFGCVAFEAMAWMSPIWRQPGQMRRLFGGLSMTSRSSVEHWRVGRIRRHGTRSLAPILADAMLKSKYVRATEVVLKLEALAATAEYADHAAEKAVPQRPASAEAEP
jgi:hypothetical protein